MSCVLKGLVFIVKQFFFQNPFRFTRGKRKKKKSLNEKSIAVSLDSCLGFQNIIAKKPIEQEITNHDEVLSEGLENVIVMLSLSLSSILILSFSSFLSVTYLFLFLYLSFTFIQKGNVTLWTLHLTLSVSIDFSICSSIFLPIILSVFIYIKSSSPMYRY